MDLIDRWIRLDAEDTKNADPRKVYMTSCSS
jgi:hypothetical protein